MELLLSSKVKRELKRLKFKKPSLAKKILKQLKLFEENSKHPSLRLHRLKGDLRNSWSISIESDLRMLYYVEEGKAIFFELGTHDEVYGK